MDPARERLDRAIALCEAQGATLALLWEKLQSDSILSPVAHGIREHSETMKEILCGLTRDMERGKLVWVPEK